MNDSSLQNVSGQALSLVGGSAPKISVNDKFLERVRSRWLNAYRAFQERLEKERILDENAQKPVLPGRLQQVRVVGWLLSLTSPNRFAIWEGRNFVRLTEDGLLQRALGDLKPWEISSDLMELRVEEGGLAVHLTDRTRRFLNTNDSVALGTDRYVFKLLRADQRTLISFLETGDIR